MKPLSLVFRILAVLGGVIAIVAFVLTTGKLEEKQAELEATENRRVTTQANLDEARETITALETERSTLRTDLQTERRDLENTRSELSASRNEARQTAERLGESNRERDQLAQELRGVRNELTTTQRRLDESVSRADHQALQAQLDELTTRNQNLQADLQLAEMRAAPDDDGSGNGESATSQRALRPSEVSGPRTFGETTSIASVSFSSGLITLSGSMSDLNLSRGNTVTLVSGMQPVGNIQIAGEEGGVTIANILPGSSRTGMSVGTEVRILSR